jgi:hypothetical protein
MGIVTGAFCPINTVLMRAHTGDDGSLQDHASDLFTALDSSE